MEEKEIKKIASDFVNFDKKINYNDYSAEDRQLILKAISDLEIRIDRMIEEAFIERGRKWL